LLDSPLILAMERRRTNGERGYNDDDARARGRARKERKRGHAPPSSLMRHEEERGATEESDDGEPSERESAESERGQRDKATEGD